MIKKYLKYFLIVLFIIGSITWAGGSYIALAKSHLPEGVCPIPYRMWAATWPVWKVLPESVMIVGFRESVKFCPNGRMLTDPMGEDDSNLVTQPKTDDTP